MAYPRSFLGLLLTGFTVVALPLVGALAYSAWNTERLAEQSRTAVFSASQAARASRSLVNRIGSIERLAQQLAGVEDPALAADYAGVHRSFRQIADELLLLPLDEQQLAALKKTVALEQQLYELLGTQPRPRQDPRRIGGIAAELAENAYEVLAISYLVADREVVRLRSNAEAVQRRLILLVIFSTAVALTIALALTRYISRPIAALDASIRQLGGADFAREITVRGPEDLQSLGERLDWLRRRLAEGGGKKPLSAPSVARTEDAADRAARRRRAAERPGGRPAGAAAAPSRRHHARQQRQAATADRGSARLPARSTFGRIAATARRGARCAGPGRGAAAPARGAGQRAAAGTRPRQGERGSRPGKAAFDHRQPAWQRSEVHPDGRHHQSAHTGGGPRGHGRCDRHRPGGAAGRARIDLRLVFPRPGEGERSHRGHRPGPRHRARVRRGARRADQRSERDQRRAFPRHFAAQTRAGVAGGGMKAFVIAITIALTGCALLQPGAEQLGTVDAIIADAMTAARAPSAEQKAALSGAQDAFTRHPTAVNRLRLATLLAVLPAPLRDDARAAELLEPLGDATAPGFGRFAAFFSALVVERQRLTRELERAARERERVDKDRDKREDALRQQLEALRAIERGILEREERLRRKQR